MIPKNFVYAHRFHNGYRVSFNGTRVSIADFLTSNSWNKSVILVEDEHLLGEVAARHDDPLVSARAGLLDGLAAGCLHPLINTVHGYMTAANTWTYTKYDAELAIAGSHPEAAFKLLAKPEVRYEMRFLLESILRNYNDATGASPTSAKAANAIHNIGVLAGVPALLETTNFLAANPVNTRLEADRHRSSRAVPEGLNVVKYHRRPTETEEDVAPFTMFGLKEGPRDRNAVGSKMRAAMYVNIGGMLRK